MANEKIMAYNVKLKKQVAFAGTPRIEKTSRGGYIIKGEDKDGNKMVKIMSEKDALSAIKRGSAKKNF